MKHKKLFILFLLASLSIILFFASNRKDEPDIRNMLNSSSHLKLSQDTTVDQTIIINKDTTIETNKKITIDAAHWINPMFHVTSGAKLTLKGNITLSNKQNTNTILVVLDKDAELITDKNVVIEKFERKGKKYTIAAATTLPSRVDTYIINTISDIELNKEETPECIVNGKEYDTLSEAIREVNKEGTIELLSDVWMKDTIVIDKDIKIKGNYDIYMIGSSVNPTFVVNKGSSLTFLQKSLQIYGSNGSVAIINNGTLHFNKLFTDSNSYTYGIVSNQDIHGKNIQTSGEKQEKKILVKMH